MAETLSMYAQGMGDRFTEDPELRLPELPYFPPEILVVPFEDNGLMFEGVRGRQVISGRSARTFIPQLLAKLDGKNTLDQLCQYFPRVPRKSMHDALALLFSRGLLEDGCGAEPPAHLRELASFAGRYADATRINRNRDGALNRLQATRVAIAGTAAGAVLRHALEDQNLGDVRVVGAPEELDGDVDVLVAVFAGSDQDAGRWLERANGLGIRTLHARVGGDRAEIGPLFVPGKSACYACFRQIHPLSAQDEPEDLGFWAGVLALNALHLISRIGPVSLYNTVHVHHHTEQGRIFEEVKLARLPGCRTCGLEGCHPTLQEPGGQTWLLHNACDALAYHALRNPRDHQRHYAAANVQMAEARPKPMFGAPVVALPDACELAPAPAWPQGRNGRAHVTLQDLATALRFGAGYQPTDEGLRRIAPGGGGLGMADLFVVARHVDGLDNGVYHYYGFGHRLEYLGEAADELVEGALGIRPGRLPAALIVGTAQLFKVRRKYDNFSFRLGTLDAGVAKGCLVEALAALGLKYREYADARDRVLANIVRLPVAGHRGMVTFAVGVGDNRIVAQRPDITLNHYHYPDSLIEMSGQLGFGEPASRQRAERGVPAGLAVRRSLGDIMLARRSLRRYADRPIGADVLEAILSLAADMDVACANAGGLDLAMHMWAIVTLPDATLPARIYRWSREEGRLDIHRRDFSLPLLEATMTQKGFAQAPVVLFIGGDFQQAVTGHGPRGYRDMLNRAGSMMLRVQLAAEALGLSGCMWGGITDDACGELLGVDRYRDCPLFGGSLGYAHA